MRRMMIKTTVAAIVCGLASLGIAGEPQATSPPRQDEANSAAKAPSADELRAEIHRTMAALIEARAAKQPDQGRIGELNSRLAELREQLRAQMPAATASSAPGWACPWGRPGRGRAGFGPGMGRGAGFGPGAGRGWGGGPVGGRGLGPGAGLGLGAGSAAFVDLDHDGICDYYELRHGLH